MIEEAQLAAKCLDLCQMLAGKNLPFTFSLKVGTNFSFSVDTRGKGGLSASIEKKKKPTPSALRRNARRREEFLNKKLAPAAEEPQQEASVEEAKEDHQKVVEGKAFKCEQCGNDFKSENGLKIHIGKAHKVNATPPPPDRLRLQPDSPANIPTSPLLDASREEAGEEKEEPVSPLHPPLSTCERCEEEIADNWHHGAGADYADCNGCSESSKQLCEDCCYELS